MNPNAAQNKPFGMSRTIEVPGDSLGYGSGTSTDLATRIQRLLPGRLTKSHCIPGQKAAQITARMIGFRITISGNAFTSWTAVSVTSTTLDGVSVNPLSTASDTNTRQLSGTVAGIPCFLTRSVVSTVETLTLTPALDTTAAVPAGSLFIPDQGFNMRDSVMVPWIGRNDVTATLSGVSAYLDATVANLHLPRLVIPIGILPSLEEVSGSSAFNAIAAVNAVTAATYPMYVPSTPPTVLEMATIGYTPTSQDNTDIAAGVFPTGMRSDGSAPHVHLTDAGYDIFALRVASKVKENNL